MIFMKTEESKNNLGSVLSVSLIVDTIGNDICLIETMKSSNGDYPTFPFGDEWSINKINFIPSINYEIIPSNEEKWDFLSKRGFNIVDAKEEKDIMIWLIDQFWRIKEKLKLT